MEFIGRTKELSDLKQEYNNKHSFVVIYGRRRIGKTALIQEFIKDKPALYFLATEESEPQSMKRFALSLSQFANQEFIAKANFDDWIELFKLFAAVPGKNTKVLVLDEFQYMLNTNPAFTSIFQKAWDEILSKQDIMVIICSSYINMMAKQVLAENSPLYGRRTSQIRLAPLPFFDIRQHYQNKPFSDVVELYSVTGGVPKYLEFFDNKNSLTDNISRVILNKNGFLYEEPAFLLNKEVKEPVNYYSVMKAIAQNNHKLSEIASAMSTEGNKLSPYLETLQGLYLLEKRVPVTEKNPEKSRKGLYFIQSKVLAFAFSLSSEIERNLISQRTKMSLDSIKASGKKLGRPFGTESKKLKLSKNTKRIRDLLDKKVPKAQIARIMGVQKITLRRFIKRMRWSDYAIAEIYFIIDIIFILNIATFL